MTFLRVIKAQLKDVDNQIRFIDGELSSCETYKEFKEASVYYSLNLKWLRERHSKLMRKFIEKKFGGKSSLFA